jgi:hypothetical protein
MVKARRVLTDTGWLLLTFGVIGYVYDLIRTGLDLVRKAGWWQ